MKMSAALIAMSKFKTVHGINTQKQKKFLHYGKVSMLINALRWFNKNINP